MNEIICPHCHKAFKVDEAGYADILKQVRDHQFEEELQNRKTIFTKSSTLPIFINKSNKFNSFLPSPPLYKNRASVSFNSIFI